MNQYNNQNWDYILSKYSDNSNFDIHEYHKILSPEFPDFLTDYINLPIMQRLSGIGLLCGTDWTKLYKNRFYYSRLDHSIGAALIVWNFTKNKNQTLSALFHDISTQVFSHVSDFRKGDALTQTASENETENIIRSDNELCSLLQKDGIKIEDICDYHKYPIADNEIPQLSADRLEYMFPSGAALHGNWTLNQIKEIYNDITITKNEENKDELCFKTLEKAEYYCEKFCETSHILQLNENKLALQLLAKIVATAIKLNIISEKDCFLLSEKEVFSKFKNFCLQEYHHTKEQKDFSTLLNTFINMTYIEHTEVPLENHFCVNLQVKQRYINPLVYADSPKRLSKISPKAQKIINDFLSYKDTPFGCVKLINSTQQ